MSDANLFTLALEFMKPNIGVILEGAAVLGIGGVAKMLSSSFRSNTAEHKQIIDHLATVNGRLGKAETWQAEHSAASLRDDHNHEITRQQCQTLHERRLEAISDRVDDLWKMMPYPHKEHTD
jgi:hypothetical protein